LRKTPLPRRRTSLTRVIVSLLVLIIVGVVGAGGVALWGIKAVQAPGPLSEPTNVVIELGQPTTEIGAVLEKEGVVADHRLFVVTSYLTRALGGDLKAGEYEFPAGASLSQVLSILRSGRSVVHKVTVPEGWTTAQVVERVNAHPALTGSITEIPAEGSLLPDTYVFQRGMSRQALIARMRDAQQAVLDELWESRASDLPIKTPEDAIILASIVEKETGVAEERPQVAAVFVNRLRRNMRLQSDPTIIYGITGGQGPLDRPISRSDIDEETPYNTYRIDGLPPTPIANPGRDAIAAVLQPGTDDHLYFVANGSGGHVFARSLPEHNANVQRWRKIQRAAATAPSEDDESTSPAADEPLKSADESGVLASEAGDADSEASEPRASEPAAPAVEPEEISQSAVEEPASAEDKARAIVAAAPVEEPSATEDAADPAEGESTPLPDSAAVAQRGVPIPKPKPAR
jgi:UPF0755 protein